MRFFAIATLLGVGLTAMGALPLQGQEAASAWLSEQRELGKLAERALRTGDARELKERRYEPAKLLGRVSGLSEAARPACGVATQALANFWRDLITLDGEALARNAPADRAQWREWQPRCEKAIGRRT